MFSERTDWPLAPNRLSQLLEERRRQALPVLDLTESNPTRCGFTYNGAEILNALADPASLTYEPDPRGLLLARQAVAGYYAESGCDVKADQIFLTTSTSEAYSYIFRLLANPGDNVLVPRPSYPLFDFLGRLADVELVPYSLDYNDGWRMNLESVAAGASARTRAILAVHPNNPTGSFVIEPELQFVAKFCHERRLALISDEVFADYSISAEPSNREKKRRLLGYTAAHEILTFTLSGLSKISGLPQMKLAWLVASGPRENLEEALARLELIADTYLSVSAPLAYALPRLLETRRDLQLQILDRVRENLRWLDGALDQRVTRLEVEGGWYVILKLPSERSDEEWALELLSQDGVLVHPGHFYDFPNEGHLVVSLLPSPGTFVTGIRKILLRAPQLA